MVSKARWLGAAVLAAVGAIGGLGACSPAESECMPSGTEVLWDVSGTILFDERTLVLDDSPLEAEDGFVACGAVQFFESPNPTSRFWMECTAVDGRTTSLHVNRPGPENLTPDVDEPLEDGWTIGKAFADFVTEPVPCVASYSLVASQGQELAAEGTVAQPGAVPSEDFLRRRELIMSLAPSPDVADSMLECEPDTLTLDRTIEARAEQLSAAGCMELRT